MESPKKKATKQDFLGKKLYIYYIKNFISYYEASHLVVVGFEPWMFSLKTPKSFRLLVGVHV